MILRFVLILIIIFLAVTAVKKIVLGFYRRKLLRVVEERFAGNRIVLMALSANFFGLKSRGGRQIPRTGRRGNGALVLTDDELWFCLAAPSREISIPIGAIRAVDIKRSHLGRTVFRPLLAVSFTFQGKDEQVAWYVKDAAKWKAAIEALMS